MKQVYLFASLHSETMTNPKYKRYPSTTNVKFMVARLPKDLYKRFKAQLKQDNSTVVKWLTNRITQYLEEDSIDQQDRAI